MGKEKREILRMECEKNELSHLKEQLRNKGKREILQLKEEQIKQLT